MKICIPEKVSTTSVDAVNFTAEAVMNKAKYPVNIARRRTLCGIIS